MNRYISFLLRFTIFLAVGCLLIARLFFPTIAEKYIRTSAQNIPMFGRVLGSAWDASGQIGPIITKKTISIADKVEQSDLGIDETIEKVVTEKNISQTISKAVELEVKNQVTQLKDKPKEFLDKAELEIRSEMYRQICSEWKQASSEAKKGN